MRPVGKGEPDSLYFTYPHFDAPKGSERRGLSSRAKVAIVGAGPVGMTAALALAKEGIPSVLLDNKPTFNDGSRAICIERQSYYILDSIGALDPFLRKSLGWTKGRSFYRNQQILEFEMPDSENEKYRPMYNIQQQYVEEYLHDAVARNDLIDMRWQSEVVAIEDLEDGVELTVKDSEDVYDLCADWVLACDGGKSPIRKMRGLRLRGENYEGRYVIADVQMDHDYPTIRRALFDPACRRGGTVLIHRQPDNIWRIDYQLFEDEATEDAIQEDQIRVGVQGVLHEIGYEGPWNLEWWSVYTANTLALDDYRDGRVFFVGDSAHIVPIFGVRGLNNGFADAINIGWKLGWVLNGKAGPDLLDSYTPERRGATMDVFANASKSARFMTPPTHGWEVMRNAALSLAMDREFAGQLANPRQMRPYVYADSPVVTTCADEFTAGPEVGKVLSEVKLDKGYLSDQLAHGFTVLCFDQALVDAIQAAASCENLSVIVLPSGSPVAELYGATKETAYLIRPDRHVAARWKIATPADVLAAYNIAVCK
ncbi:FAD-dependent monooxygenase [Ruegeria sp. SCP11]|uniref:FAD-dependent monooxygenase n=1 Tax=Ruegeria sp. SCP11 TaxID=3141378 RepID=UPI00333C0972